MASTGGRVPEDTWTDARTHWSEGAALEIVAVAAAFSFFNRLSNALQVEITK